MPPFALRLKREPRRAATPGLYLYMNIYLSKGLRVRGRTWRWTIILQACTERETGTTAKPRKPRSSAGPPATSGLGTQLGITDPTLQPNHAWRHTFKQIADHAGITERTSNYITGHAQKDTGATYGAPTLPQMADAMKKFPRYVLE